MKADKKSFWNKKTVGHDENEPIFPIHIIAQNNSFAKLGVGWKHP